MDTEAEAEAEDSGPVYDNAIDFKELALQDAEFAKVLDIHGRLNFKHPQCVKQLTRSLLKRDFGLKIELPDDRLCPPVPVRYNYVRWIQSLIDTTSPSFTEHYCPSRQVVGIDIGTGASCIYPLLACARRPAWRMYGLELDEKSAECAQKNVILNHLLPKIQMIRTSEDGLLLPLGDMGLNTADFVICNPPFFTSKEEMMGTFEDKKRSPNAVCTGADIEMICPGGDLGFIGRIIDESVQLRERIQWYSAMPGKWSTVKVVVERLKKIGITNWAVGNITPGGEELQKTQGTQRWVVAWSFGDLRPRMDIARSRAHPHSDVLPFPSTYTVSVPSMSIGTLKQKLFDILAPLDMRWQLFGGYVPDAPTVLTPLALWLDDDDSDIIGLAKANVWSRTARRKKTGVTKQEGPLRGATESGEALGVKIMTNDGQVDVRWLKGTDQVLFESFCGYVKRGVTQSSADRDPPAKRTKTSSLD